MKKEWSIYNEAPKQFKERFSNWSDIVVQMFYNRGLKDEESIEDFFNPKYEKLFNPYLLKDMDVAIERIITAIEKEQSIVIFGDYDVDGITSTAVMFKILGKFTKKIDYYIPHRMEEGYGLNNKAIDSLVEKKTDLIITVDNGVSNIEEVAYAKKKGIDVIITDHHEVGKKLPKAVAVIDPKRKDSEYPFRELAGVGVAFKVAYALVVEMNKKKGRDIVSEGQMKWYLDLVALGTIADIAPLVGENRIISHFGLLVLSKTRNVGLQALAKVAGIDLNKSDPYMVGFQISPRLNSAGRMAHAITALELLLTKDEGEAGVLSLKLEKLNRDRQETISKNIEWLKTSFDGKRMENILILKKEGWTSGIIGLIAGRISEEFGRPVFCMAEENGLIKGSVRSSVEFNVIETLSVFEEVFVNYGGHKGAGGFSLRVEDFEVFSTQVVQYGENKLSDEDLASFIKIEKKIEFDEITKELYENIKKFEPFGHENEEPLFVTYGVKIKEAKKVGKENAHTKLKLVQNNKEFSAILFNHGEMGDQLYYGKDVDVVYKISENEWNGKKNLELKIEDLR